jgi:hypothetical protein
MLIHSAVITGSVQLNNTDVSSITNVAGFATTASVDSLVVKTGSYASTSSLNELQSKTGSYATTSSVNDLQSVTGSYATTSSFGAYTSSNDSTNTTQNTRLSTIESRTGSFATTGSNTFIGTNVFTGSVFITSDLVVQGSSSLQNITASAVSIGTNTVILNTNTPILQFGGISVQDSGSTAGRSGSLLWNSVNDHWINVNPSGSDEGYNSAMVINGPKNTGSLGAEVGLTTNYIPVSQGEDHITDSIIFQSGSNIGIGTTSPTVPLTIVSDNSNAYALNLYGRTADNASTLNFYNNAGSTRYAYMYNDLAGMYFGVNGSTRLFVSSSGNVGIGTTSPGNRLAILGADETTNPTLGTNAGKFGIFNGVGAGTYGMIMGVINNGNSYLQVQRIDSTATAYNLLLQPSGGSVGIGIATSNPGYKLEVNGTGYFTGLSVNGTANVSGVLTAGAFQGIAGQIVTSVGYGSTTLGSYDLNNLAEGMYIVTGYMVRGGAGINETYTQTWFYSRLPGGSAYVSTIANNGGPGNCYGGVSISGTTVSIGWCGQRGPAAITALRLRDAF